MRNFAEYATDLDAIMEQVVLPDCPPPIFALGHSMGGAIAIRACHDGSRWFERVVLSAPMLALRSSRFMPLAGPMARILRMMGRGSAYIPTGHADSTGSEDFLGNVLTSDPVRFARNAAVLEEAPELGLGSPTIAWADAAMRAMKGFAEPNYAAVIRQPILMVAAGRDEVVSTPSDRNFRHQSAGRPASHSTGQPARDPARAGSLSRPVLGGVRRLRAGHAAFLTLSAAAAADRTGCARKSRRCRAPSPCID